jgi:hypothetical protein
MVKELFDFVAVDVQIPVMATRVFAGAFGWDN